MRIGEAARAGGVSARSLRHYEEAGLIVPGRLGNGFRDYCGSTLDRVLVIRSLLASGLPLRLVREILPQLTGGADGGHADAGGAGTPGADGLGADAPGADGPGAGLSRAGGPGADGLGAGPSGAGGPGAGLSGAVCAEFLDEVRDHRDRLAARIAILSEQRAALDAYLREAGR